MGTRFLRTPGIETHQESHPARVRGVRDTLSGCGSQSCQSIPEVRKKRIPLANFPAPLRGALHTPPAVPIQDVAADVCMKFET